MKKLWRKTGSPSFTQKIKIDWYIEYADVHFDENEEKFIYMKILNVFFQRENTLLNQKDIRRLERKKSMIEH